MSDKTRATRTKSIKSPLYALADAEMARQMQQAKREYNRDIKAFKRTKKQARLVR